MSKINDLIKELCPNGVEYKNIKELCRENFWVMPSTPNYQNEGIPYITSKNIKNGKVMFDNVKYITENDYKSISSNRTIKENDFLISMIGTIGEVGIVKKEDLPFYGQNMYLLRLNVDLINIKYFYHYFTSSMVRNLLIGEKNNGNQGYLKTKNIEMLKVPVPPLEVQEEIVKILDKFGKLEAELEAELETELEARKSQYEFWRGKLLNMDYQKIKLLNLCDKVNNINWKDDNNNYKYIDLSSVNRKNNQVVETSNISKENAPSRARQIVKTKDVLFGTTRPMLKRITLISQEYDNQICSTGYCVLRPNREKVVPEWLYFNLQTEDFYKYVENFQQGASYPSISDNAVKSYEISLPPIDVQIKVINVLTKFDKLTNDISEGLPTEIELRRKQYEYYRNKLLNFEELKNE